MKLDLQGRYKDEYIFGLHEWEDETPDYVENHAYFQKYITIQVYY